MKQEIGALRIWRTRILLSGFLLLGLSMIVVGVSMPTFADPETQKQLADMKMFGPDLRVGAVNPALVGYGAITLMLSLLVSLSVWANGGVSAWLAKGDRDVPDASTSDAHEET